MSDDPAFLADPRQSHRGSGAPPASAGLPVFRELSADRNVNNIELNVSIELGRVRMRLSDVLQVADGSVLELDKLTDEPVDVVVNDRVIARGEVVVLNDKLAVRICEVMPAARDAHL
jgi:flagellar motor switch protein FliN